MRADNVVGAPDSSGTIRFSHKHAARVRLEDCTITNQGVACYTRTDSRHSSTDSDEKSPGSDGSTEAVPDKPCFWKRKVPRSESCSVVLRGRSEFVACGVEISGDALFEVPDGQCMEVGHMLLCAFRSGSCDQNRCLSTHILFATLRHYTPLNVIPAKDGAVGTNGTDSFRADGVQVVSYWNPRATNGSSSKCASTLRNWF